MSQPGLPYHNIKQLGKLAIVFLLGAVVLPCLAPLTWLGTSPTSPTRGEVRDPQFADIAPIVFAKCSPCHNANIQGIPRLASHKDFKSRRTVIARSVSNKLMPYCGTHSELAQTCRIPRLTEAERVAVTRWCLFTAENEDDTKLAAREYKLSWTMGNPGRVFRFSGERSLKSPLTTIEWNVKAKFRLDEALTGFELLPNSPLSLRFARLYAVGANGKEEFIGEWSMNAYAWRLPNGLSLAGVAGMRVKATHHATGKASEDVGFQLGVTTKRGTSFATPEWLSLDEKVPSLVVLSDTSITAISVDAPPEVTLIELRSDRNGESKLLFASRQVPAGFGACNFVSAVRLSAGDVVRLRYVSRKPATVRVRLQSIS